MPPRPITLLRIPEPMRPRMRAHFAIRWLRTLWSDRHPAMQFSEPHVFFNINYVFNQLQETTAGHEDWYLAPLEQVSPWLEKIPNSPTTYALDLGCGSGSVRKWARQKGFKWFCMGIDMAAAAGPLHQGDDANTAFGIHDLERLQYFTPERPVDIITAVNALNYVSDLMSALNHLHRMAAPHALLVIIDPVPSVYWARTPGSTLRTDAQWQEAFAVTGWEILEEASLSVDIIKRKPLLRFSRLFVCRKKEV